MDSFSSHGRELRKIFYKFVHCQLSSVKYKLAHLELFNVKYKFLHLQLFGVKFLFSEKPYISQAELFSRYKQIFEVPHPVHEYTITRIPNKRYQTNTVRTFWGTRRTAALSYLGVDHFSRYCTKYTESKRTWKSKMLFQTAEHEIQNILILTWYFGST